MLTIDANFEIYCLEISSVVGLMRACGAVGVVDVGLGDAQVDILHTNTQCLLGELGPLDDLYNNTLK